MGHNTSPAKQDEIRRKQRVAELQPFLVPGWRIDLIKVEIVPVETVLGAFERGKEVLLRCAQKDCRRRVVIDLWGAVQAGLGDQSTKDLVELLRCKHWSGCQLSEVSAIYPQGVPLVAYLRHSDALIAITCQNCTNRFLHPPAAMIAKLKRAGRGDGSTGVIELAKLVRGPCRKCWRQDFASNVIWSKAPGSV